MSISTRTTISISSALLFFATVPVRAQMPDDWKRHRSDAVMRLQAAVEHPEGKAETLLALSVLADLHAGESIPAAYRLLKSPEPEIRAAAARLVAIAPARSAVMPLCEALESYDGKDLSCGISLAHALAEIGDPAALPALRAAAKRGFTEIVSRPLGSLGDEQDFENLLASVRDQKSLDSREALMQLVKRSNKPFEPWMSISAWTAEGVTTAKEWDAWWAANKSGFHIVKTVGRPAAPEIADLVVGTVELPDGFSHLRRSGVDSIVGSIRSADGKLEIRYDIGAMAGNAAESVEKEDVVSSSTEKAGDLEVLVVVAGKERQRVIITIPAGAANFFANIRGKEDIETVRKLALTFKRKKN